MDINLPTGFRLEAHEALSSTNEEAAVKGQAGEPEGLVVWSRQQTAGRGRGDREWISQEGNLFVSVLLRPPGKAEHAGQLSLVAALAVLESLCELGLPRDDLACKWPNDILLKGAKLGGLLLESSVSKGKIDWLVLGIGLNIAQHPDNMPYPAISLHAESIDATVEDVLQRVLSRLALHYTRWQSQGFQPVRLGIQSWLKGIGEPIEVRLPKETLKGTFEALDEEGALVLSLQDGKKRRLHAGEVFFE